MLLFPLVESDFVEIAAQDPFSGFPGKGGETLRTTELELWQGFRKDSKGRLQRPYGTPHEAHVTSAGLLKAFVVEV